MTVLEDEFDRDEINILTKRVPSESGSRFDVTIVPANKVIRRGLVTNNEQRQDIVRQIREYIDSKK